MMDAAEYVKEKVRMCHTDPTEKFKCDRCPMFADTVEIGCVYWEETDPAEAVRIVEEWSKAHPKQIVEGHEAADVKPVVHGRWIFKHGYSDIWCSVCDEDYAELPTKFNFCPNCGADMREVDNG